MFWKKRIRACTIHKTDKNYKIITVCPTDTGTYILHNPVFILDLEIDPMKFYHKVKEAFKHSRKRSYHKDSLGVKVILNSLKERSFKHFYQNSTSCNVFLRKSTMTIEPNICYDPERGLEVVEEDIIELRKYREMREEDITRKILTVLAHSYDTTQKSS